MLAAAIAGERDLATLVIASGGRAGNAILPFAGAYVPFGEAAGEVVVPTLCLDDLLALSRPSLVKIDIEGAELAALRGATRLLAEVRPSLIVEIGSEAWPGATAILTGAGYRISDPDRPDRELDHPLFNVLATPRP